MSFIKKVISGAIGLILLTQTTLSAQFEGKEVNHLIVSIDTKTDGYSSDSRVSNRLLKIINDHKLLSEGDYLSILQYSVAQSDATLKNYVRVPSGPNVPKHIYEEITKTTSLQRIFSGANWAMYSRSSYNVDGYSLSSIAKPYSVAALTTNTHLVNRTFIALVTDHRYNAQDFYQELEAWRSMTRTKLSYEDIMKKCFDVEKEYFMSYIETSKISVGARSIYIDLYELVPMRKDVSFPSVFYYPKVIEAKRVKNKGYLIELPISNTIPEVFKTKRIDFRGVLDNGKNTKKYSFSSDSTFRIYSPQKGKVSELKVSAWLNIHDGFYNATLLTPDKNCSPGLNETITVNYPEDEKVFGIPLSDAFWIFYPNDQKKAAIVLTCISAVLLVILALFLLWLISGYRPRNNQIHLQ